MRTRLMAFVLLVALTAVSRTTATAQASSSSGSSSSAEPDGENDVTPSSLSNATQRVVSVWTSDDACSATTLRSGCVFPATCNDCLSRSGCAIESTTGKCVSMSRIDPSLPDVEYFWEGKATYCAATDAACDACSHGSSDAPCYGEKSCFCLRECELQSTDPLECHAMLSFTQFSYFIFVAAIVGPFSVCIHVRRARRNAENNAAMGLGRLVFRRRRRDPEPHPMALKLDNWKKDRQDHSEEFNGIELKSCFIQMDDGHDCEAGHLRDSQQDTVVGGGSLCSELEGYESIEDGVASDRQERASCTGAAQAGRGDVV